MMKKILNTTAAILVLACASVPAHAWNQKARYINALRVNVDGSIKFTLYENGRSGNEQMCSQGNPWFRIQECITPDAASCTAYADRLASMLMNAKLSNKAVHIHSANCSVFEVALKP